MIPSTRFRICLTGMSVGISTGLSSGISVSILLAIPSSTGPMLLRVYIDAPFEMRYRSESLLFMSNQSKVSR